MVNAGYGTLRSSAVCRSHFTIGSAASGGGVRATVALWPAFIASFCPRFAAFVHCALFRIVVAARLATAAATPATALTPSAALRIALGTV
jgi:hypothetical protein